MWFRKNLLKLKNVNGFSDEKGKLEVFVEKKEKEDKLDPKDVVPKKVGIPFYNRKKTDVIEIGEVKAQTSDGKKYRPIPGGCEIAHFGGTSVGTLGGYFKQKKLRVGEESFVIGMSFFSDKFKRKLEAINGREQEGVVGITNCHVAFKDVSKPKRGDSIKQPFGNSAVVFKTADAVAVRFDKSNEHDITLLRPTSMSKVETKVIKKNNRVTIAGIKDVSRGDKVWKRGRTTQYKEGTVQRTGVTININFDGKLATFTDMTMFSNISSPGDSGSLILDEQNNAVALLNSGSETYTFGIPMMKIKREFGLEIV